MKKEYAYSSKTPLATMLSGMKNFNYANITRIVFGKGQIAKLPSLIPKDKKVLVVYGGGSIKRNGVYNQVMEALKGYTVGEFGGIEANPDFDTAVKATDIVKSMGVDDTFLLAVGGGSVADATKFIAAASKYTETPDPWNMVLSGGKGLRSAVPLGCVMTLPAVSCLLQCIMIRQDPRATMELFCHVDR